MSLIHDALKKAQDSEKPPLGSGLSSFHEAIGAKKPAGQERTLVLAAILVAALAVFAYMKLSPKKAPESLPPAPALTGPSAVPQAAGEQEIVRLKKTAIDSYKADDYDTAWTHFSTLVQLNDKDPEVWNNLGLVARKRGDAAKAREAYQKALELKPEYPEALNNLAVLDMQAGDNAKAMELLQKAVKLAPANPEANFHLALLHEQKGDKPRATEYYKRFLEVGKGLPGSVIDTVRDHIVEIEP